MTSIAALDLIQGLNQVVRAAANDDARPLLTGVLFTTENGTLAPLRDGLVPPGGARRPGC